MIELATERRVDFEGCFNFRDLGGYSSSDGRTVRRNRLYRSDALHYMTRADATHAREVLGVRTVIDLRAYNEVLNSTLGPLVDGTLNYHHLPIIDLVRYSLDSRTKGDPFTTVEEYLNMLEAGGSHVATLVRLLADDVYPAVFHCTAGKDRTGISAAFVLSLLGVSDADIVEDYALTGRYIEPIVERLRLQPAYRESWKDQPASSFAPPPETMSSFLDAVRQRYGSTAAFVGRYGVYDSTIQRLRSRLLA